MTHHYPNDYSRTPTDALFEHFHSSSRGLSAADVIRNRISFPIRPLQIEKELTVGLVFLKQFINPLVLLLLAAAIFSAVVGEYKDLTAISAVLLINAALGTSFELRTDKLTRKLRAKLTPKAVVRRDGKVLEIAVESLVSGDVVLLQPGLQIPADIRLVKADFLQVDESALTGESLPAIKTTGALSHPAPVAEQTNMAFAGTNVVNGSGEGIVVAVGRDTFQGTIQEETLSSQAPDSPLIRRVQQLNRIISVGALIVGGGVFSFLLLRQHGLIDALQTSVALIVAMVPEGLPILLTLTLILGVNALAKEHALVKNLAAVDTLAAVDALVADKTGTLTQNKLEVSQLFIPHKSQVKTYKPEPSAAFASGVTQLVTTAVLANELLQLGNLEHRHDPLEKALITMAEALRSDTAAELRRKVPHRVLPFSSEYKFMAAFYRHNPRTTTIYLKGAWEVILERCHYLNDGEARAALTDKIRKELSHALEKEQALGRKTIAFATLEFEHTNNDVQQSLVEQLRHLTKLTLVGAVSLSDPLRPESRSVIHELQDEGLLLKIASGDHATVTTGIAHAVHLPVHTLPDATPVSEASHAQIAKTTVFARVSPLDKLKIIRSLQKRRHVVAMTGDGANDAPALKQADIGIALHAGGNDIARAAADIVLTDNSLKTIANAIRFGRMLTRNLQRIMLFLLTANLTETLIIVVATFTSSTSVVLLPGQILWLNLITDTPLTFPLAFDRKEEDARKRIPRTHGFSLDRREISILATGGAALVAAGLGVHFALLGQGIEVAARQTALLQTLILGQVWLLLALRTGRLSITKLTLQGNRSLQYGLAAVLIPLVLFQTFAPIQLLVQTVPLSGALNLLTVGASLLVILVTEVTKPLLTTRA